MKAMLVYMLIGLGCSGCISRQIAVTAPLRSGSESASGRIMGLQRSSKVIEKRLIWIWEEAFWKRSGNHP